MTIEAFKESIKKWEGVVAGTHTDIGSEDCALCQFYVDNNCEGCPIKEKTNSSHCGGTPYVKWAHSTSSERGLGRNIQNFPGAKPHAEAMLQFLKDLLKKLEKGS